LYDAVVLPDRSSDPIDILQVTTAKEHDVVIGEFAKLLKLRQDTAPIVQRGYRFLMVRVAVSEDDVNDLKQHPLLWRFVSPRNAKVRLFLESAGFPGTVCFYECIWNVQNALIAYKKEKTSKAN
jgi:hypothetical protein